MASSVLSCGVKLQEDIDWRGSYERADGSIVPAQVVRRGWKASALSAEQIEEAQRKVAASMTPPEGRQIGLWIAELSVITARREDAPEIEELRMQAYSQRLAGYPADVVREALLVRGWKFFPAWAELQEVCDRLVAGRRQIKDALDRAAAAQAERELRARALPTEGTVTLTHEESEARRKRRATVLGDMIAEMKAKAEAERVKLDEDAIRAAENFAAYRPRAAE